MNPEYANTTLLSCLFLFAVGISLQIVALVTTHWVVITISTGDTTFGLFKVCLKGHCVTYDDSTIIDLPDDFKDCRVLCILAIIMYGAALLSMIIVGFQRHRIASKNLGRLCLLLSVVGGIFVIAGVSHFVKTQEDFDDAKSVDYEYGYSLHLAWVSGVAVVIAGIMGIFLVYHYVEMSQGTGGFGRRGPFSPYAQNMAYPPGMGYPQSMMMNQPMGMRNNSQMMQNMYPGQNVGKRDLRFGQSGRYPSNSPYILPQNRGSPFAATNMWG